jgi:UDP-N-acetylmuramoyl-tripeptide--D-alanyl-D-alanine ligase
MHTIDLYSIFLKHPAVTTDSRDCRQGSVFFALRGEKFDGNDYIEQALANGAAFAVGDRADLPEDSRIIRVESVLQSLQQLANYHRKQLNPKVLAITGSNGKTTTKELIATALSTQYPVLFTQGNLNNHIGVPLTLLRLTPEHRIAVVEMGANHPGEIRELCRIADPDFGLITNVGKAHLEGFGSFEGVVRTKGELYDYIREKNGLIFVNIDNPILKERSENANKIYYGTLPEAFVQGQIIESESALELEWKHKSDAVHRIKTQLVGSYNFENVLAAICIVMYWEVDDENLNQAIAGYIPSNNRSQSLKTQRNHLIIDAYNANPSSMQVALDNFLNLKVSPKMAIMGEMKELGEYSQAEHQKLVDRLRENAIDKVILCGESFLNIRSIAPEWKIFRHTQELLDYLQSANLTGFHILIKGSRSNQLEKTITFL